MHAPRLWPSFEARLCRAPQDEVPCYSGKLSCFRQAFCRAEPPVSMPCHAQDDADDRADEQNAARGRLDEEAGQPFFRRLAIADIVPGATRDPNQAEHACPDIAEIEREKP